MLRKPAWACAISAALLSLAAISISAFQGQSTPEPSPLFETIEPAKGQYLGPASCASSNCHGSAKPRDVYDVKQNEYFTWLKHDKHTQAYNVLLNEVSERIARNMKLKGKAYESALCLDCHAWNAPKSAQARPLDPREGITCEACHGPAGGWIARHTEAGWTHENSVNNGMTDLKNLAVRAETCLACHLGNGQKTVDHELIAAGHPDLIFELENFTSAMPPHWKSAAERRKKQGLDNSNSTQVWAVGLAVSFRQGMLQMARRARLDNWPEFAEMDCQACHHSLKEGAWRQVRGYKFKAGQPRWSPARFAVLRHLIRVFAPEEETQLEREVEGLAQYIAKLNTPPERVAQTASALAERMARIIPKIMQARIDNSLARRLVRMIAEDVPYLIEADVHSVEQAVMGINALVSFMAQASPGIAKSEIAKAIDKLYDDIQDPESFDRERFVQHMDELQRLMARLNMAQR